MSVSMLPVSGAEQLNRSEPVSGLPIISYSGTYSRLLSASGEGQHHRLAFLRLRLRMGQPHAACNLAAPVHCARRPPLTAVDDVLVAVAPDLSADIGGVRGGVFLFNDPTTTEIYALSQHDALPIFLLLAAVEDERLHV